MPESTPRDQPLGGTAPTSSAAIPTGSAAGPSDTSLGDKARQLAGQATDQTASLVDQVKDKAATTLEGHKAGIADQLEDAAHAIHQSGEQLRGRQDWLASAVDRGAAELSTLASSIREKDFSTLVGEVQSFARRQPAAFIGVAFAAGFALARFGKLVAADVSKDDLPTLPEISRG